MATKPASKEVVKQEPEQSSLTAPDFLKDRIKRDAGAGVSGRAEDNLIPLLYILQAQSPQAVKQNQNYIKGAEAGDIWLRNCVVPIVKAVDGVLFQPCFFNIDYGEWIPRNDDGSGGGFVARHLDIPEVASEERDEQNPNKVLWRMPNGNEIIETRNHYGLIRDLPGYDGRAFPYSIPLSSTGHSVSRAWMALMNQFGGSEGEDPVSFSRLYRLKTIYKTRGTNSWFMLDPQDGGWVRNSEEYDRGLAFHNAIKRGEQRAEAPVNQADDAAGGSGAGQASGQAAAQAGI